VSELCSLFRRVTYSGYRRRHRCRLSVVSRNLHENILGVVAFRNFRHAIQISRSDAADVFALRNYLFPEIYHLCDPSFILSRMERLKTKRPTIAQF
jgi:hypothetical protein